MFGNLLKKLAGKAGLDNIRMDLEQLKRSFPSDPVRSSKFIFSIQDEICFAIANEVSPQEVKNIIDLSCQNDDSGLQQILDRLLASNMAHRDGDQATARRFGQEVKYFFLSATGVSLDFTQRTFFQKRAGR
jgi:hypothetical protein